MKRSPTKYPVKFKGKVIGHISVRLGRPVNPEDEPERMITIYPLKKRR